MDNNVETTENAFSRIISKIFQKISYKIFALLVLITFGFFFTFFPYKTINSHKIDNKKVVAVSQDKPVITQPAVDPIQSQLNDISEKLSNIEMTLNNKGAYVDIDDIKASLATLIAQVNKLSNGNNQEITDQINQSKTQINDNLSTIQTELSAIKKQNTPHHMVDASNLPFQVVSIDDIQNEDVVTVHYNNHMLPITLNQKVAGWTLIKANTENQTAQFEDKSKNYTNINLDDSNNN